MAKRRFREIARVAGLVNPGLPGRQKSSRQIQASSGLFFDVFHKYDPQNLLLQQATREVLEHQLNSENIRDALSRMATSELRIVDTSNATPLAFPIMVNRLRASLSSEKLADRVKRMQLRLERIADNQIGKKKVG
jgi:ATP-dependent Lhr-like helicase